VLLIFEHGKVKKVFGERAFLTSYGTYLDISRGLVAYN
jgi:hypothetical protein